MMQKEPKKKYCKIINLIRNDLDSVNDMIHNQLSFFLNDSAQNIYSYVMDGKGKKLRPILLILVSKAFGYRGVCHHKLAAIIELIHNATLLHDDVIDGSQDRRGKNTVGKVWGQCSSLLMGDYICVRCFDLLSEIKEYDFIPLVSAAVSNVINGEMTQYFSKDVDEKQYLKIIQNKTATLFSLAAKLGAIICDNNSFEIINTMETYGRHFGMAYQLVDDIVDIEHDKKQGNITLPTIRDKNYAKSLVNYHKTEAINQLENIPESQYKNALKELVQIFIQ